MEIRTYVDPSTTGVDEYTQFLHDGHWLLVIGGWWSDGPMHGGYIEYFLREVTCDTWALKAVERNRELDNVTQEDVDEGRLNDDQVQAMWGMTLEEAQSNAYEHIVAVALFAPDGMASREVARLLYTAVSGAGGKVVTEPEECGLVEA